MYDIFKSDRQTYFCMANQISGNGNGAPGQNSDYEIEK